MKEMKGYVVPILTPFNRDGSIDEQAMRQNISYLIDQGIHGITLTGSFGEFPLLSSEERIRLYEVAVDEAAGRAWPSNRFRQLNNTIFCFSKNLSPRIIQNASSPCDRPV